MTQKKSPPAPTEGGSYVRQKDGSLKRVEFTAVAEATAAGDADPAPASDEQEG